MCKLARKNNADINQIITFFKFRVDDKLKVRITDSALSRDLFPGDYSCLGDNENRPIKWLAIESLVNKQFSGATDVVSIFRKKIRQFPFPQ